MILKHYYHIFADGFWREPVEQHVVALQKSGLYEALDGFYVGIIGTDDNILAVKDFLRWSKIGFQVVTTENEGWEQETQDKLYEDAASAEEPFKVLYAHTKGAANVSPVNESWRELMTEITVMNWEKAVRILDCYDATGALWLKDGLSGTIGGEVIGQRGFFAGTFWWANSTYIADLGYPKRESRWDAESWVGETGRVVDHRGATTKIEKLPSRDIKICDMYMPIPNLLAHLQQKNRNKRR